MLSDSDIMAQVRATFREEQAEHRQKVADLLLRLERDPDQPDRRALFDQLFREAHSLKGGARAAQQLEIEQIAHRIEDLFSAVRQGHIQLTPQVCDPVYTALDAIGALIEQPADLSSYQPLLAALAAILEEPAGDLGLESAEQQAPAALQPPIASSAPAPTTGHQAADIDTHWTTSGVSVRLQTAALDQLLNEAGELMACAVGVEQQARVAHELAALPGRWQRIWQRTRPLLNQLQTRGSAIRPTVHYLDGRDELPPLGLNDGSEHSTEALIEALAQANVLIADMEQRLALHARQALDGQARLHAVADRLYQQVRRTRMQPVATLFHPLRLQLREIARAAGKHVALNLDDGGAEADRQVLEQLGEVLLHLLRNAVDHGIEAADQRLAAGKPTEGRIGLCAAVHGERLALTIADDGAGLDLAAIRQRALASGEWSEADWHRLSQAERLDLIFRPGFSTRSTINTLSGRGIGLDIVRTHVERMRGQITVQSQPGRGCTFVLNLPLSLTSIHGLLLRASGASYALALDTIQRIIPVSARDLRVVEGRQVLMVDDRPVMLMHLSTLLGETPISRTSDAAPSWPGLLIGNAERQVICLVDMVLGEQELMVQRLPPPLQQVRCIAGATILADGTIVPILDMAELLHVALGTPQLHQQLLIEEVKPSRRVSALVVDDSITTRMLARHILEAAGYLVYLATDGADALRVLGRLASADSCDVILSDVDMPHIDGFELTARVRADPRFRHMPVVLITSLDTAEDRERGISAGADAYILKRQFDQQTLLETIKRLI